MLVRHIDAGTDQAPEHHEAVVSMSLPEALLLSNRLTRAVNAAMEGFEQPADAELELARIMARGTA